MANDHHDRFSALWHFWRWPVAFAITLGFVFWLEWVIGWQRLFLPWTHLSPLELTLTSILMLATYLLRAIRILDYFRSDLHGQFVATLRLTLLHNFFNNFLPMRTGEVAFPVLMHRYFGIPVNRSIPALLWLRLLDLHVILALGWSAISQRFLAGSLSLPLLALWLLLPALIYLIRPHLLILIEPLSSRSVTIMRHVLVALPDNGVLLARTWLWTAANWSMKLGIMVFLFTRFDPLSWIMALPGMVSGELGSVLPVHGLAGVGTYEASILAGLLPQGVALKPALAAAVNLHLFILGSTLLGALGARLLPRTKARIFPRQPETTHSTGKIEAPHEP